MYYTLYSLLHEYIYGLDAALTSHQDLVLTLCATIGALFVIAIPFFVVFKVISLFCRL